MFADCIISQRLTGYVSVVPLDTLKATSRFADAVGRVAQLFRALRITIAELDAYYRQLEVPQSALPPPSSTSRQNRSSASANLSALPLPFIGPWFNEFELADGTKVTLEYTEHFTVGLDRSKAVFKQWLAARPPEWSKRIEVVAMDGFAGFKTAAEELPDAVPVMDPFHVVRLAGDALDQCRCRVQQDTVGHRGRAGDPLYKARRTLHTGADLLTEKQQDRRDTLFAGERHVQVECTWGIYQRMISAYRAPDRAGGSVELRSVIDALTDDVPRPLVELRTLGRTLARRVCDVLAYFERPRTSNGPTEAVNGRLEHLRGLALGFRNLTNYIARALLEAGGFRPRLHPGL